VHILCSLIHLISSNWFSFEAIFSGSVMMSKEDSSIFVQPIYYIFSIRRITCIQLITDVRFNIRTLLRKFFNSRHNYGVPLLSRKFLAVFNVPGKLLGFKHCKITVYINLSNNINRLTSIGWVKCQKSGNHKRNAQELKPFVKIHTKILFTVDKLNKIVI